MSEDQNPQEQDQVVEFEVGRMPPQLLEAKDTWMEFFHGFVSMRIDEGSSIDAAKRKIKEAADLADCALLEVEKRWTDEVFG